VKPITLTYWTLRGGDHFHLDPRDYHEGTRAYPTLALAVAAAEEVLRRVVIEYEAQVVEANARPRPEAAKKAWSDETKHACETETRIVECVITPLRADPTGYRTEDKHDRVRLEPVVEIRRRWREARSHAVIRPDGATEITYSLADAGPWGEWKRGGASFAGGPYLSMVEIEIRPVEISWGCTVKELTTWAKPAKEARP